MIDSDKLDALYMKLTNLTEPCRLIDAEIVFDFFAKPVGKHIDGGPIGYTWPENDPTWSLGHRFPGRDRKWFEDRTDKNPLLIERDGAFVQMNSLRILELTRNVNDAIDFFDKMIPDCDWGITSRRDFSVAPQLDFKAAAYKIVPPETVNPNPNTWNAYGASPAIALMAVIMRKLRDEIQ